MAGGNSLHAAHGHGDHLAGGPLDAVLHQLQRRVLAGAREQPAVKATASDDKAIPFVLGLGAGGNHDAPEQMGLPCPHHPFLFMPVLLAMDLPVGSQVPFESNPQLPLDPIQLAIPMGIENTEVESFDPVARAASLASSLPRTWCGTFQPFDGNPTVDVTLELTSLTAMGQMVDLRGSMTLGSVTTPVQGNLHAKSDQLDLIPLGDPLIAGVEPGGMFLGLQGFSPTSWQSPRLINSADPSTGVGGRLALTSSCQAEIPVQPLW